MNKRTMKGLLIGCLCILVTLELAQATLGQNDARKAKEASSQSSDSKLELNRKRLAEINTTIIDLERRTDEISKQRKALDTERSSLIAELARYEDEQEFRNGPGYLVVGVEDQVTITLLMHGHNKVFRLLGVLVLPSRRSDALSFLKKELVGGRAYVRCEDATCNWGFVHANRDDQSINAKMVKAGLADAGSSLSLDEKLSEPVSVAPPGTTVKVDPTGTDSGKTAKPAPGTEVHVRGYTRKDGTYVQPHTRSAPNRRP